MIKISKTQEEFRQNDIPHGHFTSNVEDIDDFKAYQIIYRNLEDENKYIRERQDGVVSTNGL